jgi:hypothetical protein
VIALTAAALLPAASGSAPTEVSATAGADSATVTWTAPALTTSGPVIGYFVTPDDETTGDTLAPVATNSTATTFTVPGLEAGDLFTFTVTARTTDGMGQPSAASNGVVPTLLATENPSSATGAAPSTATHTAGGGSLTATGEGLGTLSLAAYPGAAEPGLAAGAVEFDVAESRLSGLSFTVCGLRPDEELEWWNPVADSGAAWASVSPAPADNWGCMSFTAAAGDTPTLSDFYGTVFAAVPASTGTGRAPATPSVRLLTRAATVRQGRVAVRLACGDTAPCDGTVRLTHGAASLATARLDLGPGIARTLQLTLTRAAAKLIAGAPRHRLTARLTVSLRGARTTTRTLVLR